MVMYTARLDARIAPKCGSDPQVWRAIARCNGEDSMSTDVARRKFLQFLAASPLFAASDLAAFASERPGLLPDPMIWAPRSLDKLISTPKEAINVFDFELVAAKNIPTAH